LKYTLTNLLTNKKYNTMKQFILMIMLFVGMAMTAQTVTLPTMAGDANNPNATAQLVKTDYVLTNTTVRNFVFTAPQPKPTTNDFVIDLDSLAGNHTNVAVAVYGQKSTIKADWTQIGSTVNWKGTTADTTIVISNATANRYSNYKYVLTGTGTGTTTVANLWLKLYLE
jgi:hypothetical protein